LAQALSPLPQQWLTESALAPLLATLGKQHRIAVGWSGGIDSTALLLVLKQAGYTVEAWHIDHGWHAQSADWHYTLQQQAAIWGIPYRSQRLGIVTQSNREAHARQGRYQAFAAIAEVYPIKLLCLGHHADDQAETVCMRLLQGAGVQGCCGMRASRNMLGMQLVRPLLHVRKHELGQALQQAGIATLEDPSNSDTSLWRNHIRHRLFPAIAQSGVAPVTLFHRWQQQALRLNASIQQQADCITISTAADACYVDWLSWFQQAQAVRVAVLQRMMATIRGEGQVLGRRHLQLIDVWREQGGRNGLDLTRCRLTHQQGCLHLQGVSV
jgi:tRNA(Ile)-lysidine synthase